ncbi:MAG: DNA polymerase III subunit alpha [bacterium]|nr:DNA polymerase III subunit alpha [bacterium]
MKFTHLHVHSHYSLLDGMIQIDPLIERAKKLGMTSLAVTDHGSMYGAIEFYKKATAAGIKPIIGMESYVAKRKLSDKEPRVDDIRYHLVLLAKNQEGYKNLIKLNSIAHLDGFYYKPRIDKEILRKYAKGIIGLSACIKGEIGQAILGNDREKAEKLAREYEDIFGHENFYLEIEPHPNLPEQLIVNKALIEISKKLNIPLVATNDAHYLLKEDAEAQDTLLCIQMNRKVTEKDRMSMLGEDFSFKTPEEMIEAMKETPEAIENTEKIAAMCDLAIELTARHFPAFPLPENYTVDQYLKRKTYEGLAGRNNIAVKPEDVFPEALHGKVDPKEIERIEYELGIVFQKKYSAYFLIVADFVNWSRTEGIISTTRGSAAGSFVSYCLAITNINPLKYNLPFERFLNPFRPSPPDIDMDFADDKRDKVIEYVTQKYGKDKVAQIVTFGTMAARASVRDVARALGIPYTKSDSIAKMIPMGSQGSTMTIDQAKKMTPSLGAAYKNDPEVKKILDLAEKLEGVARHASVHAAGVVISPTDLTDYLPLQKDPGGEKVITQYEMGAVEEVGLVKMDFLGIRNLSILGQAVKIVKGTKGITVDFQAIPMDDKKTFDLLTKGQTMGVFQLSGSGMTRYLKELKPTTIFDIMAMVALFRPGPMNSIPEFIARKHNPTLIKVLDPRMRSILDMSYGIITYQDDVLLIAINIAGYTWEEADKLRKAMGKKIAEEMARQKIKFTDGAIAGGMTKQKAQELFTLIEPFAAYGFNKAHAASYANVAYYTAYMKANFPAEFMAAVMTAESDDTEKIAEAVEECENMGIKVLPPDINESLKNFTYIDEKTIRFGLLAIKNIGEKFVENLVAERKAHGAFKNFEDILERLDPHELNKKSIEALAKTGAFDKFLPRHTIVENIEKILEYSHELHKNKSSMQASLFGDAAFSVSHLNLPSRELTADDKTAYLNWEKELMGLYVSGHPLARYSQYFKKIGIPIKDLKHKSEGSPVKIGAIINSVKKIMTKTNRLMVFAEIEDLTGKTEAVVFAKVLDKNPLVWTENNIVIITGKVNFRDNETKILVDEANIITEEKLKSHSDNTASGGNGSSGSDQANNRDGIYNPPNAPKIFIKISADWNKEKMTELKNMIAGAEKGINQVILNIESASGTKTLKTPYSVNYTPALQETLEKIVAKENIRIE